jgi:hypothetical protein
MKTWAAMYLTIWIAFFEILTVLFLGTTKLIGTSVHVMLGVILLVITFYVYRQVRKTPCPGRIKLITRTTFFLAIFQAALGISLSVGVWLSWGNTFADVLGFFHVGVALAIITQASSSATAFDMWEEKEFMTVPTA